MIGNQHKPRFGYPTKRIPNPERPRKKGVPYHNDMPRYSYRRFGEVLRLYQLHATKGWRLV